MKVQTVSIKTVIFFEVAPVFESDAIGHCLRMSHVMKCHALLIGHVKTTDDRSFSELDPIPSYFVDFITYVIFACHHEVNF